LNGEPIPPKFNHTYIVLIPKKQYPTETAEFRPISLCNVCYKPATKVITNCLKVILPNIISDNQSTFTSGRQTTDNILVAFEVFHSMKCHSGANGSITLKLDMSKAYDMGCHA